ncbi:hypothetical protein CRE_17632 [Caenorhabditis remanei]|uniref:Uncharacterized protein n=1 Tax=Caenorhabditis remanei TaxID=31234 RepID=E3NJQ2_CAERE|nr:hypothetical protein CRE_17632 [Caenorhabditis remanei]
MHQTLILLLFLVSVYSAVHADSERYARELRNSTESSGGPEHGKLNLTKRRKNPTIKNSVSHFPINKTREVKGNLEKHTPRKEKTKIHHTTPKEHQETKGRSHSNRTITNNLHTVSSQKLTGQHEKKLGKTKIPEQMKRVTEKVNAILRSTQNNRSLKERNAGKTYRKLGANSTKHKVKPKRKLVRKLSSGPALTEDDERTLVDQTVDELLTGYKNCQTSQKSKKDFETCIDKAQNKEKDNIGTQLTNGQKCKGGAELEKCKDRILKKAVDAIPLSIPIADSYSGEVTSSKYGKVKIGLILAKNFDDCYDKNDKSDEFLKCLKAGGEKSPLNVAYDSINAILVIFCKRKTKDPKCSSPKVNTPAEFSKEFDLLSKHKPIEMSTFKSSYDNVELGTNLDKEAEKCKQEKSSDKFIECLKGLLKTSAVKKVVEEKIASSCKGNEEEQDCRDTGKKQVTTEINDVVNALLTNFCGKTNRKEQAFQSCIKNTLNNVPIDVAPAFLKIDFTKRTNLKDIVAGVEYGKIAVGSIVEGAVKNCENPKSFKNRNDFIKCLGSSTSAPLKSAMEAIDSLILKYCESIGPKLQIDYDTCKRTSKASDLSNEFSLSFKLLDEIPLSNFYKKDENGEIKIGEIWKKGTDSCKSHKTRDEYSTCLKGESLKATKNEIGQQLATQCGKVEIKNVDDCRDKGKDELEARLKDAMDALLTNFCRDVFSKPENEYSECLNFDVSSLEPFSEMDNIPATIYAAIDISKLQTTSEHGEIKMGELLQNAAQTCTGKTTINEYFDCVVGPGGSKSSPWIDATDRIVKQVADLCGQKENIRGCRSTGQADVQTKMIAAMDALLLNFCGKNAGDSQQKYSSCTSSADQKKGTLSAVDLPISLRNEVSLPSLVISKYGNIRIGEIIQKQGGMCKNMKTLDEVVDCLKTSKGVDPSPAKAARDSISDKFADYALQQKLGDVDWKQGLEEVRKEFKNAIQALISNFCRDNVNTVQNSYIICLDNGLVNSEVLSQGYTPTDVFLQCSLKTTESDFNQCIDTVTSQRLSSWTASCGSKQECTDAAKKSTAETLKVANLSARLVACKDAFCIQSEKQKVIDAFTKEDEKYCKTPCKDSKARVESAVEKSFCSIDPANLKCQAFSCPTVFDDTPCQNDGEVFKKCQNTCNQVEQSKLEKKEDGGPNYLLIVGVPLGIILLLIGAFFGVRYWLKRRKNNKKPEKKKNKNKNKNNIKPSGKAKEPKAVSPPPPPPPPILPPPPSPGPPAQNDAAPGPPAQNDAAPGPPAQNDAAPGPPAQNQAAPEPPAQNDAAPAPAAQNENALPPDPLPQPVEPQENVVAPPIIQNDRPNPEQRRQIRAQRQQERDEHDFEVNHHFPNVRRLIIPNFGPEAFEAEPPELEEQDADFNPWYDWRNNEIVEYDVNILNDIVPPADVEE